MQLSCAKCHHVSKKKRILYCSFSLEEVKKLLLATERRGNKEEKNTKVYSTKVSCYDVAYSFCFHFTIPRAFAILETFLFRFLFCQEMLEILFNRKLHDIMQIGHIWKVSIKVYRRIVNLTSVVTSSNCGEKKISAWLLISWFNRKLQCGIWLNSKRYFSKQQRAKALK